MDKKMLKKIFGIVSALVLYQGAEGAAQERAAVLLEAAENDDLNTVQAIIDEKKTDLNCQGGWRCDTALHVACRKNRLEIVELLLAQKDIDYNKRNARGETALWIACFYNHPEIAKRLLQMPNIDCATRVAQSSYLEYSTPLIEACNKCSTEIVWSLMRKDNVLEDSGSVWQAIEEILFRCAARNYTQLDKPEEIVRHLLKNSKVDTIINAMVHDTTLLHTASACGSTEITKLLLDMPGININCVNSSQGTPLHLAAYYNRKNIVELLLNQSGINIDFKTTSGETALDLARKRGYTDIVELIENSRNKN